MDPNNANTIINLQEILMQFGPEILILEFFNIDNILSNATDSNPIKKESRNNLVYGMNEKEHIVALNKIPILFLARSRINTTPDLIATNP